MSLENFRKASILLHKADDPILKRLVASEGEHDGRQLEVQLTNRYVLEAQRGVKLRLYWRHLRMGNQGITDFETKDVEKGLFIVSYPESMLNAGNVSCFVQVIDGHRITNTQTFTVVVEGSRFSAQTAIASDEYTALNDALIRLDNYQKDIDSIKQNLQSQADALISNEKAEFDQLQADYEPLLLGLQSQFDDVMANLTTDSELIAARSSNATGESYSTAGSRLDSIEKRQIVEDIDTSERHTVSLEIKGGMPRIKLEEV
ncbi:hypothetical protein FEZ48_02865 [Marinilactibacillus psychrotolerans]|uniref:BppU N-terminal domain-containing protein n=1 Tax=Marinilactibacillus psychrotolerans TaxID=191770 RepID=A0A5R9C6T5_9LACT|nr:BppU family phage baseplate upper protein [Marinilactibacillus psychrotolerans]TLQ08843.1 hypothetical protein FEZ48_02865 [Marinilactibacillus psychrotolerans]